MARCELVLQIQFPRDGDVIKDQEAAGAARLQLWRKEGIDHRQAVIQNVGQAGGGGVTSVGLSNSGTSGGDGGAGYDVSAFIGGSALYKSGGGGGGGLVGGASGSGVGGSGGSNAVGNAAGANTGSGGGGAGYGGGGRNGGNGGSGICYIRWVV